MPTCTAHPNTECTCEVLVGYRCTGCNQTVEDPLCERCELCDTCCANNGDCVSCANCERVREASSLCENCNACSHCCNCITCCDCGVYTSEDDYCSSCETCLSCCGCGDTSMHCREIQQKTWKDKAGLELYVHHSKKTEHKHNKSTRYCAAEIEIAKLELPDKGYLVEEACINWGAGIVHDGSLPETGFEINTVPANGDLFIKQVDEICSALQTAKAKVTQACGMHVHIDARDFSYWEIRRLIILYAKIEDALFSLVSSNRRNSTYCKRCGEQFLKAIKSATPKKIKSAISQAVYKTENITYRRTSKYDDSRYTALNLHSWFYRGTVECRLFGETSNAKKIKNWGMLWCGILDWVYTHKEKDFKQFDGMSSFETLVAISPTKDITEWLKERRAYNSPPEDE